MTNISLIKTGNKALYHLLALVTVSIWGLTFVSTKTLIKNGLEPTEIFILRFVIAYLCILTVTHKRWRADNAKDEFLLFLAGLSGGSLYFITENTALGITFASNVSLLICTTPIFTMLLGKLLCGIPLKKRMLGGSSLALFGVGLVIFNGAVTWGINPIGDLLTIAAAILWALYCLILKSIGNRYDTLFITRKVFFYGIVSALVIFILNPTSVSIVTLTRPAVYGNLLFLGVIASMLCYIMWNSTVKVIGAEKAANYIYCTPVITIFASVIILQEPLTIITILGATCVIGGVYLAER